MTGVIIHGHIEIYFLLHPDTAKDSNMEATCISRSLDILMEAKFNGSGVTELSMPRSLVLNADNTAREAKNQFFLAFCAALVSANRFDWMDIDFAESGHTHNELDQRFSELATSLSSAPVLEDIHEFAAHLSANVKPVRGRLLHIEVLGHTCDFKSYLQPLGMGVSGIAPTHFDPDVHLILIKLMQAFDC